ncbi:hypothetical protein [Novosphingobium sp.]|uniref:hypothetical protein n=1 Tax=Novosphingobium sp. TaxID=1874826 RepID=UPI0025CF41C5|nr:hypothetical protein [Novosphingobium sp.]
MGGTLFVAGLVLHLVTGHGYGLIIGSLIVIGSVLLERRYRNRPATDGLPADRWTATGERFIDSESGEAMQVWVDSLTGERRYLPATGSIAIRD